MTLKDSLLKTLDSLGKHIQGKIAGDVQPSAAALTAYTNLGETLSKLEHQTIEHEHHAKLGDFARALAKEVIAATTRAQGTVMQPAGSQEPGRVAKSALAQAEERYTEAVKARDSAAPDARQAADKAVDEAKAAWDIERRKLAIAMFRYQAAKGAADQAEFELIGAINSGKPEDEIAKLEQLAADAQIAAQDAHPFHGRIPIEL